MAIDTKLRELEPSMWQKFVGESCFEKNAFEYIQKSPTRPLKLDFRWKNILGNIRDIENKNIFVLKLFLRPILFHGKLSFANLNYFKLYGNQLTLYLACGRSDFPVSKILTTKFEKQPIYNSFCCCHGQRLH